MDFLIGYHIFQGKERKRKKNIVEVKPPTKPPHTPPHLKDNIVIFLMPSRIDNLHHLNTLHMLLKACKMVAREQNTPTHFSFKIFIEKY
jgi:hypothetical protein